LKCKSDFDFELIVTVVRSEELVAEAEEKSGTQKKGNIHL
jgi:hypothetical protein